MYYELTNIHQSKEMVVIFFRKKDATIFTGGREHNLSRHYHNSCKFEMWISKNYTSILQDKYTSKMQKLEWLKWDDQC